MLPEVLLVDWQLPGMDGLQALAEARQRLGGQRLPASLIISASEREQIARLDTAHVVDRILSKPVSSSELFNAVNSSVARHFGSTERVCRATRMDAAGTLWLSGLHLLLVDDSEINLEVASLLLSQQGARVHTCRNGREALEALQAAPQAYDAVLMDVQMPEMDGYEATRRLRRELGLLELPVLALTAGALAEERRQAQAAGMNDFLSKPLEPALLIGALRRAVEHARGQPLPVMTQAAPEQIEGWPQIHGIDAASAARRMSHDQRLFRSALQRLLEEFAPFGDVAVLQGMASEQAQELCARLHKLRGSAGLVGAELLRQLAGQAESALRESVDPQRLSNLLASLSQALVSLGHAAAAFLAQQAQPQPVAAAPLAELPAELARLAEQLASNDIAALEQFERLQPNLAALLDATTLEHLSQAVDTLQFRLALDIVQPLLRGSGEPGGA
jgi:CheY-like chemotaxis protein/HPt (histidine-containing phosphotransfer) domain-containing protein